MEAPLLPNLACRLRPLRRLRPRASPPLCKAGAVDAGSEPRPEGPTFRPRPGLPMLPAPGGRGQEAP